MFDRFFGGARAAQGAWPKASIVKALSEHYGDVEELGGEQGFSLYGVTKSNLNFVVALLEVQGAPDRISEIGFLARFVGFSLEPAEVEMLNRNLHISVCRPENDDFFLLAGIAADGGFNPDTFKLILQAWQRDLTIALLAMSGNADASGAFPVLSSPAALKFSSNAAPEWFDGQRAASLASSDAPEPVGANSRNPSDLVSHFLSSGAQRSVCRDCGGRGKRGLIATVCGTCDGVGLSPLD
ncbi:MAG: hypothetical protein AAF850_02645 [Pseudomonadota bacterium]